MKFDIIKIKKIIFQKIILKNFMMKGFSCYCNKHALDYKGKIKKMMKIIIILLN